MTSVTLDEITPLPSAPTVDHLSLREEGRTVRFRRGERLFLQGFNRGCVLTIHSGAVRIVATTIDGDEVTVALGRAGDVIGSHSVLTGDPARVGVEAIESGEATIIESKRYRDAVRHSPDLMMEEIHRLIEMLYEAEARLIDVATGDVCLRVARHLQRLCGSAPAPVALPLTQTDLASMVGAGRASVSPVLADLRERGVISTKRGRITVLDPDALT